MTEGLCEGCDGESGGERGGQNGLRRRTPGGHPGGRPADGEDVEEGGQTLGYDGPPELEGPQLRLGRQESHRDLLPADFVQLLEEGDQVDVERVRGQS